MKKILLGTGLAGICGLAVSPAVFGAEAEEADAETVSIVMVGDILLHDRVEEAAFQEDGTYDFSFIFDQMKDEIAGADLAIVNEEVIIGGEELGVTGYPEFNAPYAIGDALAEAGFDVVCHATNHALDRGADGILNAIRFWKEQHPEVIVAGINESYEEQDTLRIAEKNGIRIAILNYTYGTNDIPLPDGMPYAVDYLNEEQVVRDLQRAEEEADFTIVCPHWGREYVEASTEEQQYWLSYFLEYGADLVIGTHPHVIGPIVRYEGVPVYYSLGNFVNWTSESGDGISDRMVGGMAQVTIAREDDGSVKVQDHGVCPVVCHVTSEKEGVTVYPLTEYPEELAGQNEIVYQDDAFSRMYCENLCFRVWGGLWIQ